jgi:hypothetical protein
MKNIILVLFVLLFTFGCGKKTDKIGEINDEILSDPQNVMKTYFKLIETKNYTKAYQLLSAKSKEYVNENEFVLYLNGPDSAKDDKRIFSNLSPIERDLDKPSYRRFKTLYFYIHNNDTSRYNDYYTLVNEDNKWKLCWEGTLLKQSYARFKDGNYVQTIKLCNLALDINPYSADAYLEIAKSYYADNTLKEEDKSSGMLKNIKYLISIEPDNFDAYNALATYI